MARSFQRLLLKVPGMPNQTAVQVYCSKCSATENVVVNSFGQAGEPEYVSRKFRNKGWIIGSRETGDICPACQEKKKQKQPESTVVSLVRASDIMPNIKAEPPREMTREDRRLVFAKIDEVYLDEKQGYSTGWSDKKVSQDLGVPQAWVKSIREENFGIEGANEDLRQVLTDGQKLLEDFKVVEGIISDRMKEAQKTKDDLSARANHLAGRISQIEKLFK